MVKTSAVNNTPQKRLRLEKLDILRAIALIGMVVFHFSWDLAYFGYISADAIANGWLVDLARIVASSFLFLSGFSLYLAHGNAIKWHAFTRRFIVIILAAGLVSLATFYIMPDNFIYFGILHEIALTSFIGLLFLRMSWLINVIVAVAVFYAPHFLPPVYGNAFLWLGLNPAPPSTFDYVPFFPWFSAGLLGLTLAQLTDKLNVLSLLQAGIKPNFLNRLLQWFGRHTLLIYLIHQPILMAAFFAYSSIIPLREPTIAEIRSAQETACLKDFDGPQEQAVKFCSCAYDELDKQGLLEDLVHGLIGIDDDRIQAIRKTCLFGDDVLEKPAQNAN
ncbi:DUF1624 domain-containing protein [Bartonella sp. HY329]|uniref:heparan-alpha-glucosaminide N-acetyltransferase n=1 Tax=unclassified Bartonella TaxID=2645622 RepID=UPI0021C724F5|nr:MULTISPECIES: heparan-alpha-glucosaminide N-acetyltransferase [unclassified Bartonella]UXM94370.1 DUF1624 domain-containing protein [Bartonella sp. HY329]UXN08693.1 DUF1624 domain-containing protein [Bartonella sp. HY328]